MSTTTVKLTIHPESGKFVVNAPGTGMRPRVYKSLDKAMNKIRTLAEVR